MMENERYPLELAVSVDDFTNCGWKDVLDQTLREGYSAMWQAFSTAARKAAEGNCPSHAKALWLLADACSMMLSPNSANEPFKPSIVMDGRRSAIPEDLSESDIGFYAEIVDVIEDTWLKARVADLVWLKQCPRQVKFALAAIDAYRLIPLDTEMWVRGGRECWERALGLVRMLKAGAGSRLAEMESTILAAFNSVTKACGFLGLWLANLLDSNGLGRAHSFDIGRKLNALAIEFDGDGDFYRSREFFDAASQWFSRSGDTIKSTEMTVAVAEGWVKEAIARVSSDQPSHMVAANFYEKAIQIYRRIPRSLREKHQVDERVAELHRFMNESGAKSLDELSLVKTPGVDISELLEHSRQSVAGKAFEDAFFAFANISQVVQVARIRSGAEKILERSLLRRLASSTHLSRDGRVIAKQPAIGFESIEASDNGALWAQMLQDYQIHLEIEVHGSICPAHDVLLQEHQLREADFIHLASQSPIVPIGRECIFGKALYAGYERDFIVSMHLLAPQIEHMVRFHLKGAGVKTTNLDIEGIENENGLSTLMGLPETESIFGEDLAFEIKALFCDALGPNLRNELAHGLMNDNAFPSVSTVYAWWLGVRLVFNTFWNRSRVTNISEVEENNVQ
ncbi:DUF4209 domain-containing protein [Shewanella sp.]|uniref:DUF4209 domain-containing protein n=1 Tax=Shewanella sp. TaxID=50422 RepID=UPI002605275E|nr:DUF4209 domain-containing protein [Shewanella sp.]